MPGVAVGLELAGGPPLPVGGGVSVTTGADGVGTNVGRTPPIGVPSMLPPRIGNEADELTLTGLPTKLPMSGVMSENWQVIDTTAGDPMSVPFGKTGVGQRGGQRAVDVGRLGVDQACELGLAVRAARRLPGIRLDGGEVGRLADRVGEGDPAEEDPAEVDTEQDHEHHDREADRELDQALAARIEAEPARDACPALPVDPNRLQALHRPLGSSRLDTDA